MKSTFRSNFIFRPLVGVALLAFTATGCSVSEQSQEGSKFPVTSTATTTGKVPAAPSQRQQMKAVRTFAKTTFRLAAIDEAQLAGLDVRAALTPNQLSRLKSAGETDFVPLRLRLSVEARNPNRNKVLLNQLEYVVLVNNREVASGSTDDVYEIGGRSTLPIPITFTANVREALAAGLAPETLATALSSWNRQPSRFSVQVRPTFQNASGRAFRTTDFEPIQASVK